jgi:hypothetical protein
MQSFAFEVAVRCHLELVFAIYIDIDRWRNRSIFGDIRWVKGSPWQEGSRLTIETRAPFGSVVDQVVQHFTAHESVSYLSHVMGITSETHVMFARVSPGETLIRVRMHLVGKVSRALGSAIQPTILSTTKRFFADLALECEAAARDAGARRSCGS